MGRVAADEAATVRGGVDPGGPAVITRGEKAERTRRVRARDRAAGRRADDVEETGARPSAGQRIPFAQVGHGFAVESGEGQERILSGKSGGTNRR